MNDFYFDSITLIDNNYIDNFIHRKLLQKIKIAGQIFEFTDPVKGVQHLEAIKNSANHLIFFDIDIPGMNAGKFLELFNTININPSNTGIIFISNSFKEDYVMSLPSGKSVLGCILKPVDNDSLFTCLNKKRQ